MYVDTRWILPLGATGIKIYRIEEKFMDSTIQDINKQIGLIQFFLCYVFHLHCYHHTAPPDDIFYMQVPLHWFCNEMMSIEGREVKCCRCNKQKVRKFRINV